MGNIAKLVVSLEANSTRFEKALQKSNKSLKRWSAQIRSQTSAVAKVVSATGVAAAGAIVLIVNRQAAEIDRLAKKASSLKIDTGDLQKLRFQAELTGVSTDQLDKSLQKMLKTVSDGKAGLSTAVRALDQLGLKTEDLSKLSTDQQFNAIAEAMKGVESQADRTRIAMDIFGRSGADLVNTLSSDLKATGAEFDSLGIKITSQQAAMVEAYNDSKTKLGTLWDGFLNQMTVAVAPAFQKVIEWLTQITKNFGGMDKVAVKAANSIINGMIAAAKGVGALASSLDGLLLKYEKFALLRDQISQFDPTAIIAREFTGEDIDKTINQRKERIKQLESDPGNAKELTASLDRLKEELNKTTTAAAKVSAVAASAEIMATSQKGLAESTDRSTSSLTSFSKAVEKHTSGVSDLTKKLFGEAGENKGPKARQVRDINFEMYAKAAKAAKDRGDSGEFNRLVGLANNQAGLAKRSAFNYDQSGQKDVLNRLTGGNAEKIGTIEFKVGEKTAQLHGNPSEVRSFKEALQAVLGNEASAVGVKAS